MNKYNKAVYKAAVWHEISRIARDRFFPAEGTAEGLSTNRVFLALHEVPEDIIQECLMALTKAESAEEATMAKFKLEEINDREIGNLAEAPGQEARPAVADGKPKSPIGKNTKGVRSK